jgi:SPP1 gp7 family putative phage head morphogenesis protein
LGGEDQLKAIIRQGFALQNTADKTVLQVDQVLAQAMSNVKQLVGSLPEESLLRGRAWKDLQPLVQQELNVYGQQLGSAIENALVDAEPEMERAAIRQAKLGGADFGPETISINPAGGRVQNTVEMALNSRVNNVTVKRLFNIDGKTKTAAIDKSLFRLVDTEVRAGMINGTPTDEIARSMIGEVTRAGIPGVDINSGKVSKRIRSQANAIARTATQDMARQVKQEVYDANADAMEGMEWQWTTALDSKTCEVCGVLDGKREKEQKALPDWPLHPNCRCQSLPIDPEDPFWNNSEVTAQTISEVPFKFNGKPVPELRGAEREAARKAGYYQSKVKVKGKTYYRKAETVKAGEPPTGYSDVLAKWAKEPTAPGHETSLVQAMGGGPIGEKRANWFKSQYSPKKDPQDILQAMLTGDKAGAQKFIPIDELQGKTLKLSAKKAAPSAYDKAIAAKKAEQTKAIQVKRQKADAKAKADAAAKAEQAAKLKAEQAAKAAAQAKAKQAALDAKAKADAAAKAAAAAKAKAVAEAKAKADALAKQQAAKAKAAAEAKAKQERIKALAAEKTAKIKAAAEAKKAAAQAAKPKPAPVAPAKPKLSPIQQAIADKKAAAAELKEKAAAAKAPKKAPSKATAKPKPAAVNGKTSDTNYDYDKHWEELGYKDRAAYRRVRSDVVEWSGNEFEGVRAAQFANAEKAGVKLNSYEKMQTRRLEKGDVKTYGNMANRLEDFIDRAPKFDGTIRRGVAMDTRDEVLSTIERYNSGKKNLGIESWTTDTGVSHRFAMGNGNPRAQRMTVLVEGNTKGAPINGISGFDNEYEVLVPSGVRYEVVEVKEKFVKGKPGGGPATKMDHTDWTVTLREIKD